MKKMNLPNKISVARIILSVILLVFLMIPWDQLGVQFKTFTGKVANMDSYEIKEVSINLNDLIKNYGSMFVSEWKLNKKVLTITVNTN